MPSGGAAAMLAGAVLGVIVLTAVHLAQHDTLWNSEEGIYALTSRLLLHGHELYRQTVAAQPPGTYLVGALLLAIHDSLGWLRAGVALLQLAAGLLAGGIVWRLTGSRLATALTPAFLLLCPWDVHEHGTLTPEVVALALLLGAVLSSLAGRAGSRTGILCGLLAVVKVPLVLPALAIVLMSPDRRRAGAWALGTLAACTAATAVVGGAAFWRDAFVAQSQSGTHGLNVLAGWWAQAGWNLIALLVCGALALRGTSALRDPAGARVLAVAVAATLPTLLSVIKNGTSLNVVVPVEALLVPLAVTGAVSAWRRRPSMVGQLRAGAAGLALLFTLVQGVSLMVAPRDPQPFLRLGASHPGWTVLLTRRQFEAAVRRAESCPPAAAYAGEGLVAFAAGRGAPADQPDPFITTVPALRGVRRRMQAVPTCR